MTPKIAPEIDELMWALAEQRDPQAIDQFGERFPELRQELGKRLRLTQGLKSASPLAKPHSIPRFTPRTAPRPWWGKPTALAFMGALLSVLAFGSYTLTQSLAKPETKVIVRGSSPQRGTKYPVEQGGPNRDGILYNEGQQHRPELENNVLKKQPDPLPPYMQPKSLEIKGTPLPTVLAMIEQACSLDIEMPDMPADMADMDVEASYQNMTGFDMLADLGAKYGFTAFRQGENKVLIIPAREVNAETSGG